jgi:predicted metal-dependent hydrolase
MPINTAKRLVEIDRLVRSRRKTIALIVHPDGRLEVRAPKLMTEQSIREFVDGHSDWIHKQQTRARKYAPPPLKQFTDGETFLFLGQSYPLHIVAHQRPALTFDGASFRLAKSALPKAKEYFARWYKVQAMEILSEQVKAIVARHGFTFQKIRISSARTRWGSCSSKGTLSFTWRLLMAPPEIVEYVVVHELVHTKIHNHSKKFWAGVAEILPEYKQCVVWLRKYGKGLSID